MNIIYRKNNTSIEKICEKISSKPLLVPAVVLIIIFNVCIRTENVIYAFVIIVIGFMLILFIHNSLYRFIIVTSILVLLFSLVIVGNRYSSFVDEDYSCSGTIFVVNSVRYKLDGKVKVEMTSHEYGRVISTFVGDQDDIPDLGSRIEVYGKIAIPTRATNPGEFDYYNYLRMSGVGAELNITKYSYVSSSILGNYISKIQFKLYEIRQGIVTLFENRDMAGAIFLGDSSLVDAGLKEEFKRMNCQHILAVSGTHFMGFMACLLPVLDKFSKKKVIIIPFFILMSILIGCLTGWSSSVSRAAIMGIAAYVSRDKISGMSLATIIMVLSNPFVVVSVGFMMTFSCSISIYFFLDVINQKVSRYIKSEKLSSAISVCLASQIGIMPFWGIGAFYISTLALPVQLLESFLAGFVCMLFVPAILLSVIKINVGILILDSFLYFMRTIITSCNGMVESINVRSFGTLFNFVCVLLVIIFLFRTSILKQYLIKFISIACAISLSFASIQYLHRSDLKMVFIDVNQGDSCLIICNGTSVLVDGGTADEGGTSVASVLDYYSIDKVDIAIMTHWDADHAGGIAELFNVGRIRKIYTSCLSLNESIDTFIDEYFEYDGDKQQFLDENFKLIRRGSVFSLDQSVTIKCISPIAASEGDNEDSVVLEVVKNGFSCILTGDIGFDTERMLVDCNYVDDCDVLKVGHHGSKYSSSLEFLRRIQPEVSIISVGRFNNYGHPSREALESLNEVGSNILLTSECGAITIEVTDTEYFVQKELI